jgi:hypothetical protein
MRLTPIVKRLSRWLGWLALSASLTFLLLVFAVTELALLIVSVPGLQRDFGLPLGLTLLGAGVVLSLVLAIAVHEVGHVVGARLAGLRPYLVQIGPVAFTRHGGRWRLGWGRCPRHLGGMVLCHIWGAGRAQLAVFLACGPLANLATGVVAIGLAVLPSVALVQSWSGQFAVVSFALGAVNLLPLRERPLDTDGLALWRILAGPRAG